MCVGVTGAVKCGLHYHLKRHENPIEKKQQHKTADF